MKCHKVKYKARGEALAALKLMKMSERPRRGQSRVRPRQGSLNAYLCLVCNNWHLGHGGRKQ